MLASAVLTKRMLYPLVAIGFLLVVSITFFSSPHFDVGEKPSNLGKPSNPTGDTKPEPPRRQPFPKKIWQSWKDDSENPTDRTEGFPHQWRVQNSGHRYERITDSNMETYIHERVPNNIASALLALDDPILRADLLRYVLMLVEGGVWSDIDVLPHRPVDEWVPQEYEADVNLVIGIENDHHGRPIWPNSPFSVQLCQYTILAKPNHPAIAELVRRVVENVEKLRASRDPLGRVTFEEVMSTTGPFAFTEVMMEYFTNVTGKEHNGHDMDAMKEPRLIGDVLVMPKDAFGWLPHENTHPKGDPVILVEHLFIGSWRGSHPGQ